ncbi:MAG: hypothetical protein Q9227_008386 [Pyrenula ochraceoflavens]
MEPIRYSTYVIECCRTISNAVEYPTDLHVAHLTHLYGLAEKIMCLPIQTDDHMTAASSSAPLGACVKSLEAELLKFKRSLPNEIGHNGKLTQLPDVFRLKLLAVFLVHFYLVEIQLYGTALNEMIDPLQYGSYTFTRLNMLYACLNSTKLCLDAFHAIPLSEFFNLPYTVWSLLGHVLVVLSRLSLLRLEGWDHNYIRGVLDLSMCVDALARRRDAAQLAVETSTAPSPSQRDQSKPFMFLSGNLQKIKAAHEAKYAARAHEITSQYGSNLSCNEAESDPAFPIDHFALPSASFLEFLDENFWQQFT